MKATITSRQNIFIAIILLALSTSCKKSADVSSTGADPSMKEKQFNSIVSTTDANAVDDNVFSVLMDDGTDDVSSLLPACAIRTYSPSKTQFPQTVTTDYGTGCTDQFGRVKKGKVIVVYSGRKRNPGTLIASTFDNFYVNGTHIEGKYVAQNISAPGGLPTYSYLTERMNTLSDGTVIDVFSSKIIVQTEGSATPADVSDDGYTTNGTIVGTRVDAVKQVYYASQIDKAHPLHKMVACDFPDSGIINAGVASTNGTLAIESINYGNGTCDDQAMFTFNGTAYPVTLPFRLWPVK